MRADRARRDLDFGVGDLVLLSTKHLELKGVKGKLKPRFVGPFTVQKLVGSNAAKLSLPDSMRVHPVFNVELLKKYHGNLTRPEPVEVDGELEYEVSGIIAHRKLRGSYQYLVAWKGYDESEHMWLPGSALENA